MTLFLAGCRHDELVVPTEYDIINDVPDPDTSIRGFYLVNEGNMGSNKCTLDYFDYFTGLYARNFYAERGRRFFSSRHRLHDPLRHRRRRGERTGHH